MSIDHDSLGECLHGADLVLADPPWRYGRDAKSNGWRSSARRHYKGVTVEELCDMNVGDYCGQDAILLMWAPSSKLPEALHIMKQWSFDFRCVFQTWIKTCRDGRPRMGLGYYSRSSVEFLLLGVRGKIKRLVSPTAHDVLGVIFAARTRHSEKPRDAMLRVNTRFSPCRKRVELFCRGEPEPGWVGWGDEARPLDVQ